MPSPDALERVHTLLSATARYEELRRSELLADAGAAPLGRDDALESLALGEVVARKAGYGRQLTIHAARAAGASWAQVGEALGVSKQSAWESHTRWIEERSRQHERVEHEGLDAADALVARALAGDDSDG